MALPPFTYVTPHSLAEVCALLAEHGDAAAVLAGGTDLLIKFGRTGRAPAYVLGLRAIPGLDAVRFDPAKGCTIGAMALLSTVAEHEAVRRHYPALASAAQATATVQIRNMGTVVGNLCNASPSADTATPLLVHDAEVVLQGPKGERVVPLSQFFRGPGKTALEGAEVVREVRVPPPPPRSGAAYERASERSRVDIAAVCVSAQVVLDAAGRCARARLAIGAVAPTPRRVEDAELALAGAALDDATLARAAELAAAAAQPISDVRAGAAWRRKVTQVLARRALDAAVARAKESPR